MSWEVRHGDCLELMRAMPDNSVDAIVTDPPYFKVKGEAWDHQWDKPAQFVEWIGLLCEQWQRVLKPNGSLYVFASPKMAWHVEGAVRERFEVLSHITWHKQAPPGHDGWKGKVSKQSLRSFYPYSERIIFAEHYGADNIANGEVGYAAKCDELRGFVFEPLRSYLDTERKRAGLTREDVRSYFAEKLGTRGKVSGHWYDRAQWMLPTPEHYQWLRELHHRSGLDLLQKEHGELTAEYEVLQREYQYLRREYDDLRREYDDLRRPFTVTAEDQYTDVWTFPTVQAYKGKHECEKPLPLMEHIIKASTRPGAVVLDPFCGSGSTGHACLLHGRQFIGMEMQEQWVHRASMRLAAVQPSGNHQPVGRNQSKQPTLFDQ